MKDLNEHTYNDAEVVQWYGQLKGLTEAESKVFADHKDLLLSAKVLDIGIGGGRTTEFLLTKCREYVGVDYSAEFVAYCRKRFPGSDIRKVDARDLSAFGDEEFDLVNFSFNGMDYSDHEGRELILSGINRVLKKKGIFFFSTHNMSHATFNTLPWRRKGQGLIYNFKTFARSSPYLWRKFMNRKMEHFSPDYAIVNDHAHNYRLFTYYSSPSFVRRQLKEFGFTDVILLDHKGSSVSDEALGDWIYVVCRKG